MSPISIIRFPGTRSQAQNIIVNEEMEAVMLALVSFLVLYVTVVN